MWRVRIWLENGPTRPAASAEETSSGSHRQTPLSGSASFGYAQSALRTFAMNTTETARPAQIHSFRAGDQTVARHPLDLAQGVPSSVKDQAPVRKRRGFFYVSANPPRATWN